MIPKISDAEWRVIQLLWEKSPQTSNEIIDALSGQMAWSPKTIKTLITRLVKKGAVKYEEQGRCYLYYPNVSENECQRTERKSFLRRVYGGALKPLLAAFIEEEKLSPEEIQELKDMLEQKEKRK